MKAGTDSKAKFLKLQRRLNLTKWQVTGLLETLWQITARDAPRGDIGRLSNEDIAAIIDWRDDEDELIEALVATGWLDECSEFRLVVHDWHEHAPRYVHGLAKQRGGFVTATPSVQGALQGALQEPVQGALQEPVNSSSDAGKPSLAKPSLAKPSLAKPKPPCSPPTGDVPTVAPVGVEEFFSRWNRFAERKPKIRSCRKLTDKRTKQIRCRLQAGGWLEDFMEAIKNLPLPGDGWQPDLDWLVRNDHNVYLLLEGAFDWRAKDDPAAQRLAQERRRQAARQRELAEEQAKLQRSAQSAQVASDIKNILSPKLGNGAGQLAAGLLYGSEDDSSASSVDDHGRYP